jgi:hypothetical protein
MSAEVRGAGQHGREGVISLRKGMLVEVDGHDDLPVLVARAVHNLTIGE